VLGSLFQGLIRPPRGNEQRLTGVLRRSLARSPAGSTIRRLEEGEYVEEIDDQVEDEELDEEVEEADVEGDGVAAAAPAAPARAGEEDVESIQDILVKQEARAEEDDDEDESVLTLSREERLEPLATKVVPPQQHEFICRNCYLVKHRSQLKDKARMLCRDCA
jgi:hypothetical protein